MQMVISNPTTPPSKSVLLKLFFVSQISPMTQTRKICNLLLRRILANYQYLASHLTRWSRRLGVNGRYPPRARPPSEGPPLDLMPSIGNMPSLHSCIQLCSSSPGFRSASTEYTILLLLLTTKSIVYTSPLPYVFRSTAWATRSYTQSQAGRNVSNS